MRLFVSILISFGFLLVTTLVGVERSHADNSSHHSSGGQIASIVSIEAGVDLSGMEQSKTGDSECSCKKKSGSLALVCGVTLALASESEHEHVPSIISAWFTFGGSDRTSERLYLLKRPPRTIL